MGYRSDVGYKIKFHDKETMAVFLAEAKSKEEYKEALEDVKNKATGREGLEIDEDRLQIVYFATGLKWYDEYSDVQSHEALIDLAREYHEAGESKVEYAFARIGEESEDVDSFASDDGYELVWVSRQIIFDED
jgi:hypothetical protein